MLYSFRGKPDGSDPQAALIMDEEGALYGTTARGGASSCYNYNTGCGTVFKLTPGSPSWTESVLYSFQGGNDGALPYGGLVMAKSGALLGTTYNGGKGGGVVFELTPSGSTYSEIIVHRFTGTPDGAQPADGLVSDSSGNLYSTTFLGGLAKEGFGTVFKLIPSGSTYAYSVIYRFRGGTNGKYPTAGLLLGPNSVLYGVTNQGGVKQGTGNGTVFELEPRGSKYDEKVLYSFKGGSDGSDPDDNPGLVADQRGNLFGTTVYGGGATGCTGGCGTVFKLARSGKGFTESVLYAFQGRPDGATPYGGVVVDNKGNLLGPTEYGGRHCRCGAIFSIAP